MARDLNRWTGIGRLGRDPETKYMTNGDAVVNFSIACGADYKDKSGDKVERTEWVNCVAYRKTAEIIGEYCAKGKQVYVEGRMQTRKWQDKETGSDRYTTEIVVENIQLLGSKSDGGAPAARGVSEKAQRRPAEPAEQPDFDDDIPF
jgi:single-strand DNA-binding protein